MRSSGSCKILSHQPLLWWPVCERHTRSTSINIIRSSFILKNLKQVSCKGGIGEGGGGGRIGSWTLRLLALLPSAVVFVSFYLFVFGGTFLRWVNGTISVLTRTVIRSWKTEKARFVNETCLRFGFHGVWLRYRNFQRTFLFFVAWFFWNAGPLLPPPLQVVFYALFSLRFGNYDFTWKRLCTLFFLVVSKMKIKISKEAMSIFFTAYLGC